VTEQFQGTERFQIIRRIGAGGTGVVYLAHDRKQGVDVALKTLHQNSPYGILRLKNEFRGLAEVSHSNLVKLHGLHNDANTWFLTMEYVDGIEILDWIRPLNEQTGKRETDVLRLRSAFEQLAHGVSALHAHGHLHRDLKPSNIMVDRTGRVLILDFGLATRVDQIDLRDIRGFSGTLEYMAPEQTDGSDPVPASDWYSVGVILYQSLTGQLPFQGKPLQVAIEKRTKNGPAPSSVVDKVAPDLDELCIGLLRMRPQDRTPEDEILHTLGVELEDSMSIHQSSSSLSVMPRLIGRESHIGSLVSALGALRKGKTVLCSLHGLSGMGKSALLRFFINPLKRRSDILILNGRCYERENVPFKAFDRVFDDLTRHLVRLSRAEVEGLIPYGISALTHIFPVLLHVPAIADATLDEKNQGDAAYTQAVAFEAARHIFHRLAHRWLLLIHIDDVHWGDEDSVNLMSEIFRLPEAPSIMMVCSFHTEELNRSAFVRPLRFMIAREDPDFIGREIEVGPLEDEQARALARYLLRDIDPSERHLDQIVTEGRGSPFLIESIARHVSEQSISSGVQKNFRTGSMSIESLVKNRLHYLSDSALRLLQVLAVAGRPVMRPVALEVASAGTGGEKAIGELKAQSLLRVVFGHDVESLEIYHDRIRQGVLSTMQSDAVGQINLDLALCLERRSSDQPESLVDHFVEAGDLERAKLYTMESADRASGKLAFEHAAGFYGQALDLHRQSVTIPASEGAVAQELEILSALAAALVNSGRSAQAAKILKEACAKTDGWKRDELALDAAVNLLIAGALNDGFEMLKDVLTRMNLPFSETAEEALPRLASVREALEQRGFSPDLHLNLTLDDGELSAVDAYWTAATGLLLVDAVRGAEFHARALLGSLESGDPYRISRSLAMESIYAAARGPQGSVEANQLSDSAQRVAQTINHQHALALSHFGRGTGHVLSGRWSEGVDALQLSLTIFREHCQSDNWTRTTIHIVELSALALKGHFSILLNRVPELLELSKDRKNEYFASSLRLGYPGLTWLAGDDPDTAERHLNEASGSAYLRDGQLHRYFALVARVHLHLYRGQAAAAVQLLSRVRSSVQASMVGRLHFVRADLRSLFVRSALAAITGDPQAVPLNEIDDVISLLETNQAEWVKAHALFFRGAYTALDAPDDAISILIGAIEALEDTEQYAFAGAARIHLGRTLGGEVGDDWIASGLSAMQELGIRNPEHMSRIYAAPARPKDHE